MRDGRPSRPSAMTTTSRSQTRPLTPADSTRAGAVIVAAFNKVFREHGFPPPFPSLESGQQLAASYAAYKLTRGVVCEDHVGRILGVAFVHPRGATAGIGPVAV